ncbi:MAG: hypothetical protein DRP65_00130 [Planctomycetota bacterium]|nr:MAG: hypothetical protein DRP65_00130 [Planctomycetota bacterium]
MRVKYEKIHYAIFFPFLLVIFICQNNSYFITTLASVIASWGITYLSKVKIDEREEEIRNMWGGGINHADLELSTSERPYKKGKLELGEIQEKLLPLYSRFTGYILSACT